MLLGLNHANISTDRLAETLAFYVDGLGLKPGPRPPFAFEGAWLYCEGQPVIHLVERDQVRAPNGEKGGIDHVAFTVADLDAAVRTLEGRGISLGVTDIPGGFGRQAFCTDPNGVGIELTEPARR